MYTIKRAAEMVGIAPGTLRAWQRRYGVVSPQRSDSGYRLYGDDDIATLRTMHGLVQSGLTPAVAATQVNGPGDTTRLPEPVSTLTIPARTVPGASLPATAVAAEADLVAAAATLRPGRITALLDQQFSTASFEDVVDRWLLPQLQRVGRAWATGELSVLAEHLVAATVQRRLHAAFDAAGVDTADSTPTVLTGLPYGAHHELGVLAFAVCLRRQGLSVAHLGANLPSDQWLVAQRSYQAAAVAMAVPTTHDLPNARQTLRALREAGTPLLMVGGGQQSVLAAEELGVMALGHQVGPAAAQLAAHVNTLASTDRRQEPSPA